MKSEQSLQDHLKKLAETFLVDQLCYGAQQNSISSPFNGSSKKYCSKTKTDRNNISAYINPFFMNLNCEPEKQDQKFNQCMKNSSKNQNLYILLQNVLQLPKLRYQQSQKIFELKTQLNNEQKPSKNLKLQKNFEKSIQSQIQGLSSIKKLNKGKQLILKTPNTNENHITLDFTPKSKILNESALQEQIDIQSNMSARSRKIQTNEKINYQTKQSDSQNYMMKKRIEDKRTDSYGLEFQEQRKANIEKNFIQNYFQSAKNKTFGSWSLNCCEGLFQTEVPKENNKSEGKFTKNKNASNFKIK